MSRTRYVVSLPHTVVIDTSACEENYNLSLNDWVKLVSRRRDYIVPTAYKFRWHHGDNINVSRCELHGRFVCDDIGCMSVNLCVSCYPVFHCTMEEFKKLFRIGKQGWCISSVVNVL